MGQSSCGGVVFITRKFRRKVSHELMMMNIRMTRMRSSDLMAWIYIEYLTIGQNVLYESIRKVPLVKTSLPKV
jgi:hypothetical protein